MAHDSLQLDQPTWLRARALRARWGGMPASTFYDRLKKGLIPSAEYPFGPSTPYWRSDVIVAFETSVNTQKAG